MRQFHAGKKTAHRHMSVDKISQWSGKPGGSFNRGTRDDMHCFRDPAVKGKSRFEAHVRRAINFLGDFVKTKRPTSKFFGQQIKTAFDSDQVAAGCPPLD